MTDDPRFTFGFITDICEVLERHGYQRPPEDRDRAMGASIGTLLRLTREFEGVKYRSHLDDGPVTTPLAGSRPGHDSGEKQ